MNLQENIDIRAEIRNLKINMERGEKESNGNLRAEKHPG